MTAPDQEALVAAAGARRGYVLDMHRLLAAWDPPFLDAYEGLLGVGSWDERALDRRTKELIYVAVLTAVGTTPAHLSAHLRAARRHGATPEELLQVLELTLAPAGVPRIIAALDVFAEVCGPAPAPSTDDAPAEDARDAQP